MSETQHAFLSSFVLYFQKCEAVAKYSNYAGHPKTRKQIGGFDALDLCYYCCGDNFCNKDECIKGKVIQDSAILGK